MKKIFRSLIIGAVVWTIFASLVNIISKSAVIIYTPLICYSIFIELASYDGFMYVIICMLPLIVCLAGVLIGMRNNQLSKWLFRVLTYPICLISCVWSSIIWREGWFLDNPLDAIPLILDLLLLVAIFILDVLSFKKSKKVQEVIEEAP